MAASGQQHAQRPSELVVKGLGVARRALMDQFIMAVLDKQRSVETAAMLSHNIADILNDTITTATLEESYRRSLNIPQVGAPRNTVGVLPAAPCR
jgi:hypothetical protein